VTTQEKENKLIVEMDSTVSPQICFKCGECCRVVPPEIILEEQINIYRHLSPEQRKLFRENLTDDIEVAGERYFELYGRPATLNEDKATMRLIGKWLKSPCMFLKDKKCSIYEIRPLVCRKFYCGRRTTPEKSEDNEDVV
jgi:Fe-S-cluster containining protein